MQSNKKVLELRKVASRNKKYKFVYTVIEEGKPIVKLYSKRDFNACYLVDGRISVDSSKESHASAFAYTYERLLSMFNTIANLYQNK
jgi:hypothetical protein